MHSDGILELGKKFVDELGLENSVDTLGRWMAHYIAEKIGDVEAANSDDRDQKMSICADEILKLWAHRRELPRGKRPFEDFEPIFRTLHSLDPDGTSPRYFRQIRFTADNKEESSETQEWLGLADGLDYTAKLLIRYCLAAAAEESVDKGKEWVKLASALGSDEDSDVQIVRILINDAEALTPKAPEDAEQQQIENLAKRLEGFAEMAGRLSAHFSSLLRAN